MAVNSAELQTFQQEIQAFWEVLDTKMGKEVHVFRQPFSRPIATSGEFFAMLRRWADKLRQGPTPVGPRMLEEELLPGDHHQDINSFCADIDQRCPRDWYLYVEDGVQGLAPEIWDRAVTVLNPGLQRLGGVPPAGCALEFFLGRYNRTPTGIHRDDGEVLAFVTHGTKKLLFWPKERFEQQARWHTADHTHYRTGIYHYENHLDDAIVVEANVGDVIYWPRQFYHIGVSENQWSGMIAMNTWWYADPWRIATFALESCTEAPQERVLPVPSPRVYPLDMHNPAAGANTPPAELMQASQTLAQQVANQLSSNMQHLWASLSTGYGFVQPPGPRQVGTLDSDQLLIRHPIAGVEIDGEHHVYACGHLLWSSSSPALGQRLMALPQGETISVDGLRDTLEQVLDGTSAAKFEQKLLASGALQAIH